MTFAITSKYITFLSSCRKDGMVTVIDPDFGGNRTGGRRNRHILVVDDERHLVLMVQVILERDGYRVSTATSGADALELIKTDPPDLIVLDVLMPVTDGFEVLQTLRKQPATRTIPVIMLSHSASGADVFKGWQSDVDGYLSKPFNPKELLSDIRWMLSRNLYS